MTTPLRPRTITPQAALWAAVKLASAGQSLANAVQRALNLHSENLCAHVDDLLDTAPGISGSPPEPSREPGEEG